MIGLACVGAGGGIPAESRVGVLPVLLALIVVLAGIGLEHRATYF